MLGRKKQQQMVPYQAPQGQQGAQPGTQPPPVIVVQHRTGCLRMVGIASVVLVLLCVGIGVLAALGGDDEKNDPDRTPTVGEAAKPAAIGGTATGDGLAITVHSARESDTAGVLSGAEAGWSYLTLDVTVKNVSDETKSFNTLYWSAKDMDGGYTYDDDLFGGDPATNLGSGKLSPGDLVRGEVVIKVRDTGTHIRIKYDTATFGGTELFWMYARPGGR